MDGIWDKLWSLWLSLDPGVPFWDPYGAVFALALAFLALGLLVRTAL